MSLRSRIISGGMLVGLGQVVTMGTSFARNVIIARTVTLADMGIASTIALALSVLEAATELSVNQLIVQAKDGDDLELQANAQTFMVLRGTVTALILLFCGGPLAHLFRIPEAAWAFQLTAIVPFIRGFVHLDRWRYHRQMRFGPQVMAEFWSQAISLAAAWPLAKWIGNYSVMLWVIMVQVCVMVAWSHLSPERPYRLGFNRTHVGRILHYGWPLMLNGILMVLLNYGDRAVIAIFPAYSMADVGLFMVASTMVMMPTMLLCKMGQTILLPALAKAQDDPAKFESQFQLITSAVGLAAVLESVLLIIAGPSLTVLFFGEKYLPIASFFGWLAAGSALRVLRLAPTLGALAQGDSRNPLIANIARCTGFAVALVAASLNAGLHWFAIAAFIGELVSHLVSCAALLYRKGLYSSTSIATTALLLATIAISMGVFETVRGPRVMWIVPSIVAVGLGACVLMIAVWISEPVRTELRRLRTGLSAGRL